MGVIIIFTALIGLWWWLVKDLSSLRSNSRSNREPFPLGARTTAPAVDPIITPVDQVKIPDRLPQVDLEYVPVIVPTPIVDRSAEVSPNFTPISAKIEESLLFRSLVVAMFAVSVFSVDFAAGTKFSLSSIPFVAIGSVWSWYRRYHGKHWLNITVSVASLGLMFGVFVPILFRQIPPFPKPSATLALILGAIVISLQMGLSFHLYSRRILGYCLLISAILIGVAAGIIHNLWIQHIGFLILCCGFMAISIPTLMLDYRSRLALQPIGIQSVPFQGQLSSQHLPWKYLYQLAAISIGLGIILAIFMPNFRLPDLSFKPPAIDQIQQLTPPNRDPISSSPSPPTSSPSNLDIQTLASKVLGQAENRNYPNQIRQDNLQLPSEIAGQLQQFTQQILATSPQPLNSDFDRSTYLAKYLKTHHKDPPISSKNSPLIDAKSIQKLIANCNSQPATCELIGNRQDLPIVYTSMLRSIGIPARLTTGTELAQIDPQTQLYASPSNFANSQTEVYFPNWGWFGLDARPDRLLINSNERQQLDQLRARLEQQLASTQSSPAIPAKVPVTAQPSSNNTNNTTPPSAGSGLIDNPSAPNQPNQPAELPQDFDPTILKAIVIILAIIGGITWYLQYQKQTQQQLATLPPIERIYRSMIISLSKTGNTKVPAQTQLEYARSIKNTEHPQIAKIVEEISQLYTAWRYGKHKIDVNYLAKKLQNLQHLQQLAANRKRQRWIADQQALWLPGNTRNRQN